MILAGDIGGTNSRIALFEQGAGPRPVVRRDYRSAAFPSLEDVLRRFTEDTGVVPSSACLALPGPVYGGRVRVTNLPWTVEAGALAAGLRLPQVVLLNDLEAVGHGIDALGPGDFLTLNEGTPGAEGNRAIIAAGTGLGQAGCYWDGVRHHPFATEGGHADFAPRDELEAELLHFLRARHGRVSAERVISGPGLSDLYLFLRDSGHGAEDPGMPASPEPPAIVEAALRRGSERAGIALRMFVSLLAAEAGNLALKLMARGGVFLGGGICASLAPELSRLGFMDAFTAKGRMSVLLDAMPVRVILNEDVGLLGAAIRGGLALH